ncbi:MAG: hypothetical protein M1491_07295 [Deltaproteobacteria bacterium]|nr:hypothetical protein [Deltaproteobacteria bacterium]MCL5277243.1 hypothetical protein [Deltaproteobacteria bacterium]
MAFLEILQQIVDNTQDSIGGIIIGTDGIIVEQYIKENEMMDFQNVGVEYTAIMKSVSDTSQTLGLEGPEQIVVEYRDLIVIVRNINKDYFIMLAIKNSGSMGKARFLIRKNILSLSREF